MALGSSCTITHHASCVGIAIEVLWEALSCERTRFAAVAIWRVLLSIDEYQYNPRISRRGFQLYVRLLSSASRSGQSEQKCGHFGGARCELPRPLSLSTHPWKWGFLYLGHWVYYSSLLKQNSLIQLEAGSGNGARCLVRIISRCFVEILALQRTRQLSYWQSFVTCSITAMTPSVPRIHANRRLSFSLASAFNSFARVVFFEDGAPLI